MAPAAVTSIVGLAIVQDGDDGEFLALLDYHTESVIVRKKIILTSSSS